MFIDIVGVGQTGKLKPLPGLPG
jgi:hypothetical protein